MNYAWTTLNQETKSYFSTQVTKDPSSQQTLDIVCAGLSISLSDLDKNYPISPNTTLTIFADTLIVDLPNFSTRGLVVYARSIDLSAVNGAPLSVQVPKTPNGTSVVEILTQSSIGGALQLLPEGGTPTLVPMGQTPLQPFLYTVDVNGTVNATNEANNPSYLLDLINRPWALNALRASYTAATVLMNASGTSDRSIARSMLSWVVACIRSMGLNNNAVSGDFAELYSQSVALLVILNVESGAYYVPVLSSQFYNTEATLLIDALQSYEDNMNTLNVQTNIEQAISQVATALKDVSGDEEQPLIVQLDNITQNANALQNEIRVLQGQYNNQFTHADTLLDLMNAAIKQEKADQFLENYFGLCMDVFKIGFSVAKLVESGGTDIGEIKEIITTTVDGIKDAKETIEGLISNNTANHDILDNLSKLIDTQQQMYDAVLGGQIIWSHEQGKDLNIQLPDSLAAIDVDPILAWDNFLEGARNTLANIKQDIGSGTGSGEAQKAANNYGSALIILGQYGKAIASKIIVYSSLLSQATVVSAQLKAVQNAEKRWNELNNSAATIIEKLAALKGMIQSRMDAIKRSVIIAWVNYRHTYFYLYFQEPPVNISISMNAAQLKTAFANVSLWIGSLLGDNASSSKIKLPNENVEITLTFDILAANDVSGTNTEIATFRPASSGAPASLEWVVPFGTEQLKDVLPNEGDVAIWITEASFILQDVTPNSKGNVIAVIATSGSYENGLGQKVYAFVNKVMSGHYAYTVQNSHIYDAWNVNAAVYSTPTPYTQWKMIFDKDGGDASTATQLTMKLKVSYLAE
jgi:hypothetical protein